MVCDDVSSLLSSTPLFIQHSKESKYVVVSVIEDLEPKEDMSLSLNSVSDLEPKDFHGTYYPPSCTRMDLQLSHERLSK